MDPKGPICRRAGQNPALFECRRSRGSPKPPAPLFPAQPKAWQLLPQACCGIPAGGLCPPAGSKKGPQRLLRAQRAAPAASCGAVRPGNSPFGKRRPLLSFCSLFEDGSTDWLICCTKSGIRLLSPAPQVQQPAAPRAKRCTAKPPPRKICRQAPPNHGKTPTDTPPICEN